MEKIEVSGDEWVVRVGEWPVIESESVSSLVF
jgi:hypothetical protein